MGDSDEGARQDGDRDVGCAVGGGVPIGLQANETAHLNPEE